MATSYDVVAYPGSPWHDAHPECLATVARLMNLPAPDLERARVLELGCGDGVHLSWVALTLPRSKCVGVDLSVQAIERGKEYLAAAGISNVELLARSLTDPQLDLGEFDFIIAHGVYSWVPTDVRDRLLSICQSSLAPDGIAFVSYNAYPGNHRRNMVRDLMRCRVAGIEDPVEKVAAARAVVQAVAQCDDQVSNPVHWAVLRAEAERIAECSDYLLFHDDLSPVNHPVTVVEFARHAGEHGLQYLGEADFVDSVMALDRIPGASALPRAGAGRLERELCADFVLGRAFRQTLLVHEGRRIADQVSEEALWDFRVSGSFKPVSPDPAVLTGEVPAEFVNAANRSLTVANPKVKAMLVEVGSRWPSAVPLRDIHAMLVERFGDDRRGWHRRAIADAVPHLYSAGMIGLHLLEDRFVAVPGERPALNRLALLDALQGRPLTSLRGARVKLEERALREFATLIDGTRTRDELLAGLRDVVKRVGSVPGEAAPPADGHLVERVLAFLARNAMLVG